MSEGIIENGELKVGNGLGEWRECELKEVAEVQTGPFGSQLKNKQYITGGTPVITVEHINNFRIADFDYPSVTDEDKKRLSKYLLMSGDIIFTRVGSVDLSAFVQPHQDGWMFSSRMLRVRPILDIDSRFLSYFFQQKKFREYILNISVGATMPSINTAILKGVPVSYPPLPEQKAIAEVLSSLDDKIDLLHRQNKTLEQMAETLFRQWFVEEAGEDWEEKPLSEVCTINNGYAFKSPTYQDKGQKIIRTLNFSNHLIALDKLVFISHELASDYKKYYLKKNDFLLVMVGASLGNFALVTKDILPALQNQNMWCFRAKENVSQHFLNFALREIVNDNLHGASGSARQFFQKGVFYELSTLLPSFEKMNIFEAVAEDYFKKIELNRAQLKTLESLRDTLLPKLMSGEIRVAI